MAASDSRQRFLDATARLLRERGFSATGMNDVVAASGAPKGSLYFHFPGGKEELVAAALAQAGGETCALMKMALGASGKALPGLEAIMDFLASELASSDFRTGCPIGTVAAEAPEAPAVRASVADAFTAWHDVIAERLVRSGLGPKRAGELSEFFLSVVEGAVLLAKARRSTHPLENARREIRRVLRAEGVS